MKLTILGCGRFQITSNYNSTGNLVSTTTTHILLDFGRGCLRTLTETGVAVKDVDGICISHTHPDHVADLLAFFQIYFIECHNKPLTIIGPAGITEWFTTVASLVAERLPAHITIHEQPSVAVQIGDISVATSPMAHSVPDVAFRLQHEAHSLVYSGDTGLNPNIVPFAHQADLLMLECSNTTGQTSAHHLNPLQCGALANAAATKQLVLTHYGGVELEAGLLQETGKSFSGILTVAHELQTFVI